MKDLISLLAAGLKSPEDLAYLAGSLSRRRLWICNAALGVVLGLLIVLANSLLRDSFQPLLLMVVPITLLLWLVCGFLAFVWCLNSKGQAGLPETIHVTLPAFFFPVLLTILLMSLDALYVLPVIALGNPTFGLKVLDLVLGFIGPIWGWFVYYRALWKLHSLKPRHAMGASLVAVFMTAVAAYFLGTLF
jgi:hypothetical protein